MKNPNTDLKSHGFNVFIEKAMKIRGKWDDSIQGVTTIGGKLE